MTGQADVAIIGYGWAGSVIAAYLVDAGLDVVVLERGRDLVQHPSCGHFHGPEGRRPHDRTQNAADETFTIRHDRREPALPIRRMGSFLSGSGVGGGGVLWGGVSPRYRPDSFTVWPLGYDDLEPGYSAFERIVGVSGAAQVGDGTGHRSTGFPVPPSATNEGPDLFKRAAEGLGMRVSALPSSEIGIEYTNPLDSTRRPCDDFGTTLATPLNTVDAFARATGRLRIITEAHVRRIEHDGAEARSIVYVKGGVEHRQHAAAYVLAAWALNNVRMLLLSGIGEPYDAASDTGVVGRGLTSHLTVGGTAFFDGKEIDNSLRTGGGWVVSEFENGLTDRETDFAGGFQIHSSSLELKPKAEAVVPPGTKRWGSEWKAALHAYRRSTVRINLTGELVAQRGRFADLDTRYRDAWGDPLLRLTLDWSANERRLVRAMSGVGTRILQATGADRVHVPDTLGDHYSVAAYQNSHLAGGAVTGTDARTSVVDNDLRSWALPNLWVTGASSFPRNAAANPTPTVVALALRAARSITDSLQVDSSDSRLIPTPKPEPIS